ncbi:hypothetical protein [Leisingera sp. ANG-Vp]|uniref:hypothetical protein n=1 Tax=Leisingera sp. ANG-Vp TaxID=1577896 RepID=UPI00057CB181|nr:hypothetical protein [Leisingera sp. ANG-Vp]KIC22506.1 hypothetical protein RA20_01110 [Leisingera sp. ANG-Vp]
MSKSFELQLAEWAGQTEGDIKFVAAEATQDLMEAAQTTQLGITQGATSFEEGKIPVGPTKDLVNSLMSGLNGSSIADGQASYAVAIGSFELGDVMQFEWTQEYAAAIEFGWTTSTGKQVPGRHYVGANVARWQEFVDGAVARVRK